MLMSRLKKTAHPGFLHNCVLIKLMEVQPRVLLAQDIQSEGESAHTYIREA